MTSVIDIAPPWLSFLRAADWGVIWKRPPVVEGQADPETFIHHGAGSRIDTDAAEAMRELQRWYHDAKNYSTIAYDVMVHRNTDTEHVTICGAREGWLSAATRDRNDIGEAICLFGYFHPGHRLSEQPTAREVEALAWAVAWSIEMGWSARDTNVMGHRSNPAHPGATGCPGDFLHPHVPAIHARALDILAEAEGTDEPPEPPELPEPAVLLTEVRAGDGWWAIARRCYGPHNLAANATRVEAANPDTRTLRTGALVRIPGRAK